MSVRIDDGMNRAWSFSQDLQTHLRRGIDQNISARSPHENAWPGALIARVKRPTDFALAANHGHARGSPTAQKNQFKFRFSLDQVGHGEAVMNTIQFSNLQDESEGGWFGRFFRSVISQTDLIGSGQEIPRECRKN